MIFAADRKKIQSWTLISLRNITKAWRICILISAVICTREKQNSSVEIWCALILQLKRLRSSNASNFMKTSLKLTAFWKLQRFSSFPTIEKRKVGGFLRSIIGSKFLRVLALQVKYSFWLNCPSSNFLAAQWLLLLEYIFRPSLQNYSNLNLQRC